MNSELDKIKSTITISLGTKNRLRKLKGSQSYEGAINGLIRQIEEVKKQKQIDENNYIELQKFNRVKEIYSFEEFKILFSYNQYNLSRNFQFDISIDTVREKGEKTDIVIFLRKVSERNKKSLIETEYRAYFQLLETAIKKEIEPLFRHNSLFADYFSWEREFENLNLSKKSFKEDVMSKLNKYQYHQSVL